MLACIAKTFHIVHIHNLPNEMSNDSFDNYIVLIGYVGASEPTSQSTREAIVKQEEEGKAVATTIKSEDVIGHEVGQQEQQQQQQQQRRQRQQQQQQLAFVAAGEAGEENSGVGVLEAGQPEMENGAMVEPTGAEAVAIAVAAVAAAADDHANEDPNATYTLHELDYHPAHMIHERWAGPDKYPDSNILDAASLER